MCLGYSESHAGDTFSVWDPQSKRAQITREILCLGRMYFLLLVLPQASNFSNFGGDDLQNEVDENEIDSDYDNKDII
jgi:hypothetical protein